MTDIVRVKSNHFLHPECITSDSSQKESPENYKVPK